MPLASGLLSARPASGDYSGDPYFATDTQESFVWNGSTWVKVGNGTSASGDMTKAVYDPNLDNVIAKAQLDPALADTSGTNTGDQTLAGLGGIAHSLATAINDFLVASGAGAFVKKTLAEVKAILDWAADIATHAALATGIHGVGASTVESVNGSQGKVDTHAGAANPHTVYLLKQMAENDPVLLDAALSADGKYSGICEAGTAGAVLAFGDLVYLAVADSRWELTDANAVATSAQKIGICVLAAAGDGSATTILLWGKVNAAAAFPVLTVGAPVFIGEVAGDMVVAAPTTSGAVVRIIGYGNTADELFFCPDNTYVELV